MTRQDGLHLCYTAQTLSDVSVARQARISYLVQHPEDSEICHIGEMLSLLEDAMKVVGEESAEIPLPTVENLTAKAS